MMMKDTPFFRPMRGRARVKVFSDESRSRCASCEEYRRRRGFQNCTVSGDLAAKESLRGDASASRQTCRYRSFPNRIGGIGCQWSFVSYPKTAKRREIWDRTIEIESHVVDAALGRSMTGDFRATLSNTLPESPWIEQFTGARIILRVLPLYTCGELSGSAVTKQTIMSRSLLVS